MGNQQATLINRSRAMVYIEGWNDFLGAAHQLYLSAPTRTRYCVKYRNSEGRLVLKVPDDSTCIKYRTNQKEQLKEVDKLNSLFFRLMTSPDPESVPLNAPTTDSNPASPVAAAPAEEAAAAAQSKQQKKKSRK